MKNRQLPRLFDGALKDCGLGKVGSILSPQEPMEYCWIGLSLADSSGLILAARMGKHTDELIEELVISPQGKTACKQWNSEDGGGYERVLPPEILHYVGKDKTQRLERTNGIVRQQTARWHRRQNKFGKRWEQTKVTTRSQTMGCGADLGMARKLSRVNTRL